MSQQQYYSNFTTREKEETDRFWQEERTTEPLEERNMYWYEKATFIMGVSSWIVFGVWFVFSHIVH